MQNSNTRFHMKLLVFDIETYKHHFCFCAIQCEWETHEELKRVTITSDENGYVSTQIEQIDQLFAESDYIISFNGSKFDLPILAKMKHDIARMGRTTSQYIHVDGVNIISYDKNGNPLTKMHHYVRDWSAKHFDLLNNCLLAKSLKQWEMYCGLPIRELPYDPAAPLTTDMMKDIDEYCMHDVWATLQVFWRFGSGDTKTPYSTLRARIELMKMWPAQLPYKFDRTAQALSSGIVYNSMQPIPPKTNQPLALFDINEFDVPTDVKLVIAMLAKGETNEDTDTVVEGIKFGKGGAHYIKPGLHKNIFCMDVQSEYPRIINHWKLLKTSEALANWKDVMQKRFALKGLKGTPDYKLDLDLAYKLILNSLSGGFRIRGQSVAFDPAAGEAMCYIGQMLITEMALAAPDRDRMIEVNTDSVFVTGEENIKALREKAKQMYEKYDMLFEEEFMDMAYFRDVNNYVVYDKEGNVVGGKGLDYADMGYKASEPAVTKELFRHLILDKLQLDWKRYDWKEFIFKYHKSAAAKYANIGGEPMAHKNYYFLWTTLNCPGAKPISFSRDLVDRKNGCIKTRFGVYAFDIKDLEQYKDYIDFNQYQRDLDVMFELWGRSDLCATFLSKVQRKAVKTLGDVVPYII